MLNEQANNMFEFQPDDEYRSFRRVNYIFLIFSYTTLLRSGQTRTDFQHAKESSKRARPGSRWPWIDRENCLLRTQRALEEFIIEPIDTSIELHKKLVCNKDIKSGNYSIKWLEETFLQNA